MPIALSVAGEPSEISLRPGQPIVQTEWKRTFPQFPHRRDGRRKKRPASGETEIFVNSISESFSFRDSCTWGASVGRASVLAASSSSARSCYNEPSVITNARRTNSLLLLITLTSRAVRSYFLALLRTCLPPFEAAVETWIQLPLVTFDLLFPHDRPFGGTLFSSAPLGPCVVASGFFLQPAQLDTRRGFSTTFAIRARNALNE